MIFSIYFHFLSGLKFRPLQILIISYLEKFLLLLSGIVYKIDLRFLG